VNTRVIIRQRVRAFLQTLAPEPRRRLWRGLKDLAEDKGDLKQLEGNLHPFWRLRVDVRLARDRTHFRLRKTRITEACL